jgi:serine/threonine protein kinase
MELSRFLRFAIGLAAALGKLHQQGLIHKDIKPANILVDSASGAVWLTGFGIASRLPRERQSAEPPEMIAGTLAHMAPEQTGRMNRSIDSRSDLYSLGVTFYEMLTGALPFTASDPMEWVHCHIARQAIAPDQYAKEQAPPRSGPEADAPGSGRLEPKLRTGCPACTGRTCRSSGSPPASSSISIGRPSRRTRVRGRAAQSVRLIPKRVLVL